MKRNRIFVMSFGLGGNSGDGVTKDGNTYSSSWYLSGPDEFVKLIPGHYDPAEVDGCIVIDKHEPGGYVTPYEAAGEDATYISRIREDATVENGLSMWIVSDNLRKGAALNAIQIAECLINRKLITAKRKAA